MILEKLMESGDVKRESETTIRDLNGRLRKLRHKECKLIKASDSGSAAILVSPDMIDISAPDRDDSANTIGVSVVAKSGVVLRGPVGFTGTPSNIRIGGLWKFNDVLLSAAPSTILTPIPVLRFALPMSNLMEFIQVAQVIGATAGVF